VLNLPTMLDLRNVLDVLELLKGDTHAGLTG
jgi:hypothetical protein